MPDKDAFRSRIRPLPPLPPDLRGTKSARLCDAIVNAGAWRNARTVIIFAPQSREPDVEMLWAHAAGRTIGYPRVEDNRLGLYAVASPFDLQSGQWGLREPAADPTRAVAPNAIDLILVPGIAFTRAGARLGRGGGYYDRLLSGLPPGACKIGVCFDVQILPELPTESHDQHVDFVATESGILSATSAP